MTTTMQAQSGVSDAELLQRYLEGEGEAFAALVRRYETPLFAFLLRFTGNRALADDVFQDTFLQVCQSAAMFDLTKPFRPWLYTVAANKARDALRKRGRHPTAPLDASVPGGDGHESSFADLLPANVPSPEEICVNLETSQAVQQMVEQMPEPLRSVLILSYFQELPHKEISDILSIPVGTVKSRLHHAIRLLAEEWNTLAARPAASPNEDRTAMTPQDTHETSTEP